MADLAVPPILGGAAVDRELLSRAHDAACALAAEKGARIAIDDPEPWTRLYWFFGADLAGAATLIVEPQWTRRERDAILDDARPHRIVSGALEPTSTAVTPTGEDDTFFYLPTTSGSSGRPRVLIRNRRSWLRSFEAFDLGLDSGDTVLVPGPLSSSLFLFAALHSLHQGHQPRLLDRWSASDAADHCRHATVIHLVPAMLSALLSVLERDPERRERCVLGKVVCGGAKVDEPLRERLKRVLPGCELIEYYGSAEHSLVAMRRGQDGLRPVRGVDVEVRDGELWARSDLVFSGYLHKGQMTPRTEAWTSVGDQAIQHADGTLTVLGRSSSAVLSSAATIVAAEEVESALRGADGVADVVVSETPHPRLGSVITAILEVDRDAPSLPALRARAREALAPAKRPRRWLTTTALPRTASGKPARALIAQLLREDRLSVETL